MQSNDWVKVDPSRAKTHPLYGVRGWLKAFLAALWIGTFLGIGGLYSISQTSLGQIIEGDSSNSSPLVAAKWFLVALATLISVLAVGRYKSFRPVAIVYLLSCNLIVLRILSGEDLDAGAALGTVLRAAIACGPWILYLCLSRRVRVTYESEVKANDPWLIESDDGMKQSLATSSDKPAGQVTPTEAMYAKVAQEVESCNQRKGLWLQCFTEAGGDEKRQLVLYTEARIRELVRDEEVLRSLADPSTEWEAYKGWTWEPPARPSTQSVPKGWACQRF
uniref:DUF2569 family protein n=2 Tax=Cupriavidus taiwanensis TaxID=164546 RepID=UPI001E3745DA